MTKSDAVVSLLMLGMIGFFVFSCVGLTSARFAVARIWNKLFWLRFGSPAAAGELLWLATVVTTTAAVLPAVGMVFLSTLKVSPGEALIWSEPFQVLLIWGPFTLYVITLVDGVASYSRNKSLRVIAGWRRWLPSPHEEALSNLKLARWQRMGGTRQTWLLALVVLTMHAVLVNEYRRLGASSSYIEVFNIATLVEVAAILGGWRAYLFGNPHLNLIAIALDGLQGRRGAQRFEGRMRPGRWRSEMHRAGDRAARSLVRCARVAVRRLSVAQGILVLGIYRKLADNLRHAGLVAELSDLERVEFLELLRAATTISSAVDLPGAAMRVADRIRDLPEIPPGHVGRWDRLAEGVSVRVQKHWSTLQIFGALAVIAILLSIGNLDKVVEVIVK